MPLLQTPRPAHQIGANCSIQSCLATPRAGFPFRSKFVHKRIVCTYGCRLCPDPAAEGGYYETSSEGTSRFRASQRPRLAWTARSGPLPSPLALPFHSVAAQPLRETVCTNGPRLQTLLLKAVYTRPVPRDRLCTERPSASDRCEILDPVLPPSVPPSVPNDILRDPMSACCFLLDIVQILPSPHMGDPTFGTDPEHPDQSNACRLRR